VVDANSSKFEKQATVVHRDKLVGLFQRVKQKEAD